MPTTVIGLMNFNLLYSPHHSIGTHFVIWSLYYLSDQRLYLDRDQHWQILPHSGDSGQNTWHAFRPLILRGHHDCRGAQSDYEKPVIAYCSPLLLHQALGGDHRPGQTVLQTLSSKDIAQGQSQQQQDAQCFFTWASEQQLPLICLDLHSSDWLVPHYNDRYCLDLGRNPVTLLEKWQNYCQTFFPDIDQHFGDTQWEQREKFALALSWHNDTSLQWLDRTQAHLYYTTDDIWNDLPRVCEETLTWLDLPCRTPDERWLEQYRRWREWHDFAFSRNFRRIIHDIIQGNYHDLARYRMDFVKEVVILRALIHDHDVRLESWGVTNLPTNTVDLHRLLSPNYHTS